MTWSNTFKTKISPQSKFSFNFGPSFLLHYQFQITDMILDWLEIRLLVSSTVPMNTSVFVGKLSWSCRPAFHSNEPHCAEWLTWLSLGQKLLWPDGRHLAILHLECSGLVQWFIQWTSYEKWAFHVLHAQKFFYQCWFSNRSLVAAQVSVWIERVYGTVQPQGPNMGGAALCPLNTTIFFHRVRVWCVLAFR